MILVYAFSNTWATNISRRTLSELEKLIKAIPLLSSKEGLGVDFVPIHGHPRDFFKRKIDGRQYNLIIGLGDYFGPSDKIRIETQAKNVYGQTSISPLYPIYLDVNLPNIDNIDSSQFKISSSAGTYNCNWIIFQTQLYLNHKSPKTFHLFFHLPKMQSASILATNIYNLLISNNLL